MKLSEMLAVLTGPSVRGVLDRDIRGVTYDSRSVRPGDVFVAIRGKRTDGHAFIDQAITGGATVVVADRSFDAGRYQTECYRGQISLVQVDDTRKALARMAAWFYGYPSRTLGMIGVTGTNGKTTTTHLVKSILEASGNRAGLIGTVGYFIGSERLEASHTTPESLDLQRLLSRMVREGVRYAVMEVSSHALALQRVTGCEFDVGVMTNFSRDHLDFHGDLESYLQAKLRLFEMVG